MALAGPSHLLSSSSSCLRRLNPLLFSAHRRPAWTPSRAARRFCAAVASERDVFTSPEVAKSFDFTSEERIYKWWESQGFFKPNFDRGGDPFVVPMPPANVTGSLHMGHAMFVTLEDIMIRYFRMKGRPALWIPGTDHAGIATQLVVEKMLAAKGVKRTDLTREEFTERVWEWKEKYGSTITNQIKRLGASCDWTRECFTLDDQLSRAVVEAFIRLHEKGLIYQGIIIKHGYMLYYRKEVNVHNFVLNLGYSGNEKYFQATIEWLYFWIGMQIERLDPHTALSSSK